MPDPCLTAILLVCQTRSGSGPQLVFHWPPDPLGQRNHSQKSQSAADGALNDESTDSDSEYSLSDEDVVDSATPWRERQGTTAGPFSRGEWTANKFDHAENSHSETQSLLGLDEDGLVSLLAPNRTWNKRKFELSINDLTFVGRPIFAKQNGSWRKVPAPPRTKERSISPNATQSTEDDSASSAAEGDDQQVKKVQANIRSELMMFHVVFVMSPPPLDHAHRVKEMYDNVVKKLSRALKWVQVRHDYVGKEAENLLMKRQRLLATTEHPAKNVMTDLLELSALAKAMMTVFNAISSSKIASVTLLPGVSISLQIPPITSTAYLPSLTEPPIPPGLWLTTATEAAPSEEAADKHAISPSTLQLAKSYTLLLKSPPPRIARDAQLAGGPLASHLPTFVAALRPTKSFYKLANSAQISLADVQLLARHLIYWRRAIAIPPLHQRDTYIVSPNADLRKLREACKSYEAQFSAPLPSLPKLLASLSDIPTPFGALIPSPDHKETYMFILAWLMRNGWVTQLRTFAYVRVSSEKKQLARDWERESRPSVSQSFNSASDGGIQNPGDKENNSRPSFVSRRSSDGRRMLDRMASLIKSPPRASPEESRWLAYLHDSMLDGPDLSHLDESERHELYRYWPVLSKYFDGTTALESIPIREGLKRKVVWKLYAQLGLSFEGRVEDSENRNERIILTVRHW